jgi:NTE family protein
MERIALVLAGGGARGPYEVGVLSAILPALPKDQLPNIVVGTSVGAINGAFLAANLNEGVEVALEMGREIWSSIRWGDVLATPSLRDLERLISGTINFTGLFRTHIPALLDASPLPATLERVIDFGAIAENVARGELISAAVVATSAHSGRSVVFHAGGTPDEIRDDKRAIDYVPAELHEQHVRASSAIPALFPAVRVDGPASGWYWDGGTRLNAPIKPALAMGAERVIVVGLNSIAPARDAIATQARPDLFGGASQIIDALLADPLVEDIETLTTVNQLVGGAAPRAGYRLIPYIFVAPPARDTIGDIARRVFSKHYGGLLHARRSPQLAFLGRVLDANADALHGELLSYLFFAPEFARALIERGRADGEEWLAEAHDDGLWDTGPLGRRR